MASPGIKRDSRGYLEPPSRGLLAQSVKKAGGKTHGEVVEKLACFLLSSPLRLERRRVDQRGFQLGCPRGILVDADASAEGDKPAACVAVLLGVRNINDDGGTGVVGEVNDDEDTEKVGWGVGPEDGKGRSSRPRYASGATTGHAPRTSA